MPQRVQSAKQRLLRYDVIRAFATFAIFAHHFELALPGYVAYAGSLHLFAQDADGGIFGSGFNTGWLAIALFFVLSGFFSYRGLGKPQSPVAYWAHRLKRLLVPFWCAWVIGTALYWLLLNTVPQAPAPAIIWTILGLDNYVQALLNFETFAVAGEWFTGAMIVITVVWPLMQRLFKRSFKPAVVAVIALELIATVVYMLNVADPHPYWLPTSCLTTFTFGLALARCLEKLETTQKPPLLAIARGALLALVVAMGCKYLSTGSSIPAMIARMSAYRFAAVGIFLVTEPIARGYGELRCKHSGHGESSKAGQHFAAETAAPAATPASASKQSRPAANPLKKAMVAYSVHSYSFYLFQHIAIYIVLGKAAGMLAGQNIGNARMLALMFVTFVFTYVLALVNDALVRVLQRS